MQFSGSQIAEITNLIRTSFTRDTFTEFLSARLEKDLADYSKEAPFPTMIFNLIKNGSGKEGWDLDLLDALKNERPKNKELQLFAFKIGAVNELAYKDKPSEVNTLEKIVNGDPLLEPEVFLNGLFQTKKCMCRIEIPGTGENSSHGTGFLISEDVVITNYHVMKSVIENPSISSNVICRFDYHYLPDYSLNRGLEVKLAEDPILFFRKYSKLDVTPPSEVEAEWPEDQLDYALIRLVQKVGSEPFGLNSDKVLATDDNIRGWIKESNTDLSALNQAKHMIILQHPKAQPLKIAIGMSKIMGSDSNHRRVRYEINTEPGSSGSACFDENFKWIALHNLGDPEWVPTYNQGITSISIIKDLKSKGFTNFDICK